jgi:hypothetical protein
MNKPIKNALAPSQKTPGPPRPRGVTYLASGVLSIAGFYTIRLVLALVKWQELSTFAGVSPGYIAFTGLVWTLCAWPLAWGLWRGLTWAPPVARASGLAYSIYYWLEQLILTSRQTGTLSLPAHAPFAAVVNLLCVLFLVWILSRAKTRAFFGDFNERKF